MEEILKLGCAYLASLLKRAIRGVDEEAKNLEKALFNEMCEKCRGHWYVQDPLVGSGYRSLYISEIYVDPIIVKVCNIVEFPIDKLKRVFKARSVIYFDPSGILHKILEGDCYIVYRDVEGNIKARLEGESAKKPPKINIDRNTCGPLALQLLETLDNHVTSEESPENSSDHVTFNNASIIDEYFAAPKSQTELYAKSDNEEYPEPFEHSPIYVY